MQQDPESGSLTLVEANKHVRHRVTWQEAA